MATVWTFELNFSKLTNLMRKMDLLCDFFVAPFLAEFNMKPSFVKLDWRVNVIDLRGGNGGGGLSNCSTGLCRPHRPIMRKAGLGLLWLAKDRSEIEWKNHVELFSRLDITRFLEFLLLDRIWRLFVISLPWIQIPLTASNPIHFNLKRTIDYQSNG